MVDKPVDIDALESMLFFFEQHVTYKHYPDTVYHCGYCAGRKGDHTPTCLYTKVANTIQNLKGKPNV